jgi:hypothetical protein
LYANKKIRWDIESKCQNQGWAVNNNEPIIKLITNIKSNIKRIAMCDWKDNIDLDGNKAL